MKDRFLCFVFILLLSQSCTNFSTTKTENKPFDSILKNDNPADNNDSVYSQQIAENYNPGQVDFSKEFYRSQAAYHKGKSDTLNEMLSYDCSSVWITGEYQQNGVLGQNYQRIQFHVSEVKRSPSDKAKYIVYGKSKVNNNICDFKGEILLRSLFLDPYCENPDYNISGDLFADYIFYEDSTQNHSGYFKGITECYVYIDPSTNKMILNDSNSGADGYSNRTFVGIWTDYKTQKPKKCIWGDFRLPFTFDFDIGTGEMIVNEKYIKYGWQNFGYSSKNSESTTNWWDK